MKRDWKDALLLIGECFLFTAIFVLFFAFACLCWYGVAMLLTHLPI